MDSPFEGFMELILGRKRERGEILHKLTPEEESAWTEIKGREAGLVKEVEHLKIVSREISLDRDKWFMKLKATRQLPDEIIVHEGNVHRLKDIAG